jgi:hypothetical protein
MAPLRVLALACLAAGTLASPAAAATLTGSVVFDGADPLPPKVTLTFYGEEGPPVSRLVDITGGRTPYAVDLPDDTYDFVEGTFPRVAPDSHWVRHATTGFVLPVGGGPADAVDDLTFVAGVRYKLPLVDLEGNAFAPPPGWTFIRGIAWVLTEADIYTLPLTEPSLDEVVPTGFSLFGIDLRYRDADGAVHSVYLENERESSESEAGRTVTKPGLPLDATAPVTQDATPDGYGYGIFTAHDPDSQLTYWEWTASIMVDGAWQPLPNSAVSVQWSDDGPGWPEDPTPSWDDDGPTITAFKVMPTRPGPETIRFCAANENGISATDGTCATATVNRPAGSPAAPSPAAPPAQPPTESASAPPAPASPAPRRIARRLSSPELKVRSVHRSGRRVLVAVSVTRGGAPVAARRVTLAGHTARTDRHGVARLTVALGARAARGCDRGRPTGVVVRSAGAPALRVPVPCRAPLR